MKLYLKLFIVFILRYRFIIVLSVITGSILFLLINFFINPLIKRDVEKIGITGRYHIGEIPDDILLYIGKGLTSLDEDYFVIPSIANSWESPDKGKTWIFKINNELFWNDKTKITTRDINYNFSDVEINKLDDYTIEFRLKNPLSSFPSILTRPIFKKGLLGSGDWTLKNVEVKNNFINEMTISKNNNIKIFKFYNTYQNTKTAFKLGKVNKIIDILDVSPFDTWKNVYIERYINRNQIITIFLNTKSELLNNKDIRQALYYSLEKNYNDSRAYGPININSWAYNPQIKKYDFNLDKAKELSKDIVNKKINNNTITLVVNPILLNEAEIIKSSWEKLGFNINITVSSIYPASFDAYLTIFDIPKDPDQYSLWHSTQENTNISKFENPRIDKLLEDGRSTIDVEERKKLYFDFQRYILEEVPAIFLNNPVYHTFYRK